MEAPMKNPQRKGNIFASRYQVHDPKEVGDGALAGLLSAGALTAASGAAAAQDPSEGEVVNRETVVTEDRDYTGLWGPLELLGLAGLAGLRRKRDDNVDVRRAPSAQRDSAIRGTSANDGKVCVKRK
jgi:hypothetical protein